MSSSSFWPWPRSGLHIFLIAMILLLTAMAAMAVIILAWRDDRAELVKRENGWKFAESMKERPREIQRLSIELLALAKSIPRGYAQSPNVSTVRLQLVDMIWQCATYESELDALGGPRATDLAYLMLVELGCETQGQIPVFYEIAKSELRDKTLFEDLTEIERFLVRALAARTDTAPVATE